MEHKHQGPCSEVSFRRSVSSLPEDDGREEKGDKNKLGIFKVHSCYSSRCGWGGDEFRAEEAKTVGEVNVEYRRS